MSAQSRQIPEQLFSIGHFTPVSSTDFAALNRQPRQVRDFQGIPGIATKFDAMKASLAQKMKFLSPPGSSGAETAIKPQVALPACHQELLRQVGGQFIENSEGSYWMRRQVLAGHLSHGPCALQFATQLDCAILRRLDPKFREFDLAQAVYFDTETTGLSGGSGTYAFLLGLAYFNKQDGHWQLVIEQLMMADHQQERAILRHLLELLQDRTGLISFNGRSFDAPLLDTRLCLHRFKERLEPRPHLDLLPWARRLWGRGLPDCRLETLETRLLQLPRHKDIPGWMIPEAYFRYLRQKDARALSLVAEHNRRDLLAMVGLAAGMVSLVSDPWSCPSRFLAELQPYEDFAMGQLMFRQGHLAAAALLERAYRHPHLQTKELQISCGRLYARALQRQQRYQEAHGVWEELAARHPLQESLWEGLAKSLEHRLGDFVRAQQVSATALALPGLSKARRRNWSHRQERLIQKLQAAES